MHIPFVGRVTFGLGLSPEDRTVGLVVCSVAIGVLLAGVLGVLLAHHVSPCNPRNLSRCGRRLASTLQGLDQLDSAHPHPQRLDPGEEAAAVCPPLVEALECYYWFSQRCLPAREQHFYAKMYVESSSLAEGLCRPPGAAGPAYEPLLVTHGACLREARGRRSECGERFYDHIHDQDHPDHHRPSALIDSLYDPDAAGSFQAPLCRAIHDFIMCGLQLVSDNCGLGVALELQNLHDNLTNLVFSNKCSSSPRPLLRPFTLPAESVAELSPAPPGSLKMVVTVLLVFVLFVVLLRRLKDFWK